MEVAGAVDSYLVGEDIGKVCDMEEPLEIPITNDLTMVLGSISQVVNKPKWHLCVCLRVCLFILSIFLTRAVDVNGQSKATGVVVDFTDPSKVYDNVKQVMLPS